MFLFLWEEIAKLTSGLGGDSWNWMKAILAFLIDVGPPAW